MRVIPTSKVFALLAWITILTVIVDLGKFQQPCISLNNLLELKLTGTAVRAVKFLRRPH